MRYCIKIVSTVLLLGYFMIGPAPACGDGEAPSACGDTSEGEAKWMLKRVVAAIDANEAEALRAFTAGAAGFRTVNTYVFCVGPDGIMTAHPNPILQGQDVRALHDDTGNYFIATMLRTAKPGQVSQIRYLFPRLGSIVATGKTTYYTRAADQVCGVGVYDADQIVVSAPTPNDRLTDLRQRLTAEMPDTLKADWTAFQQALDEASSTREAAVAQARQHMEAADALFAHGGPLATDR